MATYSRDRIEKLKTKLEQDPTAGQRQTEVEELWCYPTCQWALMGSEWVSEGKAVQLHTNSKNASAISQKGSTTLRFQKQALEIFQFCTVNNMSVEIEWVLRSLMNMHVCFSLVAFAGFLGFGELCNIKWCDIVSKETYFSLFIPRSKTDQYRSGPTRVVARASNPTCPLILICCVDMLNWAGIVPIQQKLFSAHYVREELGVILFVLAQSFLILGLESCFSNAVFILLPVRSSRKKCSWCCSKGQYVISVINWLYTFSFKFILGN